MKLTVGFQNAIEALKANKGRTALTMLGILIGVAAIILLISVGQGIEVQVSDQIKGLGSNMLFVSPGSEESSRSGPPGMTINKLNYNDVLSIQSKNKMGMKAVPMMSTTAIVKYGNNFRRSVIGGTTQDYAEVLNYKIKEGKFFTASQVSSGRRVCVIGKTIADDLFRGQDPIGKGLLISGQRFKIIGVFEEKGQTMGQDQDDRAAIPITVAQTLFGKKSIDMILLQSPSEDKMDESERMATRILSRRLSKNDFNIASQKDMIDSIKKITGIITAALGGIAGISLVVGGIGIMNIMLVTVTERTREIGIRKAIGARESDILVQFIIESVVLSVLGGIAGIALGYGGAFFLKKFLPTSIAPWSIGLAFGFSVFIGVFFGVYPANKAAKMDPIEALRQLKN